MRPGKIKGKTRARICARRADDGNSGKRLVRDWRHRGGPAATGACGDDGGNCRGDDDCRKADAADSQGSHSECDLLRAADWLDWVDGKAGARCGIFSKGREISIRWEQQGDDSE